MNQIAKKMISKELSISKVLVDGQKLTAHVSDGRVISIPISWFPRLAQASNAQLQNFEISPSGYGIHWPDLDEDISIKSFIS